MPFFGNTRRTETCLYYSHWSNLPVDGFEAYFWPGRYVLLFPADDGLTCVAVGWAHAEFHRVRANLEVEFAREIQQLPSVADRLSAADRAEPLRGTSDLPGFVRVPRGPGWALAGDAGWRVDPITGTGLTYAFRDAELLADAIGALQSNRAETNRFVGISAGIVEPADFVSPRNIARIMGETASVAA